MTSRTRKSLLGLIVFALVAALLFVAFRPTPIAVDFARIERGRIVGTINADGKTRIRNVYDVSSPISGTAQRSPVAEGDAVTGGQTIVARVEPAAPSLLDARTRIQLEATVSEARAAADFANAQLRQAEEELDFARSQLDRTRELVERGVSSVTALENAEQALRLKQVARDAAASNVARATSSLARAEAALIEPGSDPEQGSACCVELRAPVDGTVLSIVQVSERTVAVGSPLLSIGDVADLEITADLLSSDAVGLDIGARAIVERWGRDDPLTARLVSLAPIAETHVSSLGIEEQRVSAVFNLLTPPDERAGLGHQYAVFLEIVTWEEDDALYAPLSALFRDGDGWAVFAVNGNRAALTPIEIGRRNDTHVEILSGIGQGDLVVVHPPEEIADGTAIIERSTL